MTHSAKYDGDASSRSAPRLSEGLREQKRRATREAIARASLALSAELGFSHYTVEQVCERVGISRRTFFNYFATKEDAILGMHEDGFPEAAVQNFMDSRPATPAGEVSESLIDDFARFMGDVAAEHPDAKNDFALMMQAIEKDSKLLTLLINHSQRWESRYLELVAARERLDVADPRIVSAVWLITNLWRNVAFEFYGSGAQEHTHQEFVDALRERLDVLRTLLH